MTFSFEISTGYSTKTFSCEEVYNAMLDELFHIVSVDSYQFVMVINFHLLRLVVQGQAPYYVYEHELEIGDRILSYYD